MRHRRAFLPDLTPRLSAIVRLACLRTTLPSCICSHRHLNSSPNPLNPIMPFITPPRPTPPTPPCQTHNMTRESSTHTDGRDIALSVGIVCEPEEQTRLSDTGVSDEEELEEEVVFGSGHLRAMWLIWGTGCVDEGVGGVGRRGRREEGRERGNERCRQQDERAGKRDDRRAGSGDTCDFELGTDVD